jgi:hypothetical protein
VNTHNKENFPTSLRKPTIRKSVAKSEIKKKEEGLNSNLKCPTRFLSGTTKSIRFCAQHFMQTKMTDAKNKKFFNFSQILFEIIGFKSLNYLYILMNSILNLFF